MASPPGRKTCACEGGLAIRPDSRDRASSARNQMQVSMPGRSREVETLVRSVDTARRERKAHHHCGDAVELLEQADDVDRPARANEDGPPAKGALVGARGSRRRDVVSVDDRRLRPGRAAHPVANVRRDEASEVAAHQPIDVLRILVGYESELELRERGRSDAAGRRSVHRRARSAYRVLRGPWRRPRGAAHPGSSSTSSRPLRRSCSASCSAQRRQDHAHRPRHPA